MTTWGASTAASNRAFASWQRSMLPQRCSSTFHVFIAKAGEGITIRTIEGEKRWHVVFVPRNLRNVRCTMEHHATHISQRLDESHLSFQTGVQRMPPGLLVRAELLMLVELRTTPNNNWQLLQTLVRTHVVTSVIYVCVGCQDFFEQHAKEENATYFVFSGIMTQHPALRRHPLRVRALLLG